MRSTLGSRSVPKALMIERPTLCSRFPKRPKYGTLGREMLRCCLSSQCLTLLPIVDTGLTLGWVPLFAVRSSW